VTIKFEIKCSLICYGRVTSKLLLIPEYYFWYITDELIDTDKIEYLEVDMQQSLN